MTTLVVGCGYLGRRVAMRLVARGERVIGTTRGAAKAEELVMIGVEPVVLDLLGRERAEHPPLGNVPAPATPHPNPPPQGGGGPERTSLLAGEVIAREELRGGLPEFDRLVYCIGFDRTSGLPMREVYVDGLNRFLERLDARSFPFVYTSSTSVYGQDDGYWVTEDDATEPATESGRVVLEAEGIARSRGASIIRLAGLYGPGRIIRRAAILAGEPIAGDPAKRVNLVQIDDAASAVVAALDRGRPGRAYNVADDRPVERQELYELTARCLGAPAPRFVAAESSEADRRIANGRMKEELGVGLAYPDITTGLPASIGAERVSPPPPR